MRDDELWHEKRLRELEGTAPVERKQQTERGQGHRFAGDYPVG
jgi:hypothetical protein